MTGLNKKAGFCRVIVVVFVCIFGAASAYGGEYEALDRVNGIKAVFDVRSGNIKSTALQLDLLRRTFTDKNIRQVSSKPDFAVVFAGPATRLISTSREGYSAEEKELLGQIAETISAMAGLGIKLEVCMFAARVFGVNPGTILPEIKQVPNGWISLIGYQATDYALIAIF